MMTFFVNFINSTAYTNHHNKVKSLTNLESVRVITIHHILQKIHPNFRNNLFVSCIHNRVLPMGRTPYNIVHQFTLQLTLSNLKVFPSTVEFLDKNCPHIFLRVKNFINIMSIPVISAQNCNLIILQVCKMHKRIIYPIFPFNFYHILPLFRFH